MTTDEAREVLEMMTKFMDRAFSYTQLKALQVAIAALEKPVYRYLPEVPQDGETVPVYVENKKGWQLAYIREGFWQTLYGKDITPYAWTRIPPKPPLKPTNEQP